MGAKGDFHAKEGPGKVALNMGVISSIKNNNNNNNSQFGPWRV